MTARDFCYWLQGCLELERAGGGTPQFNARQTAVIEQHLALVFKHEIDTPDPTGELQATHDGKPAPQIGGTGPDGTVYRC